MSSRSKTSPTETLHSHNGNGTRPIVRSRRSPGGDVVEMQRRRLLAATTELVYEHGVQAVTIALISDRAGVSRKTFYEIFADREVCLEAAFEKAVARAKLAVGQAGAGEERWRERMRAGLGALLSFLDSEPVTARLLVVEALSAGEATLDTRRRAIAQIVAIVDEGRREARRAAEIPPLTAEGVVGAVFSVIHARLLARVDAGGHEGRPLVELTGPLTAIVVQPYLGSAAVKRELRRPAPATTGSTPKLPSDPFKDLPIRLTYRTARVLASIAAAPGSSSKQIAVASEIADEGQMSRLLARLERAGMIENTGAGPTKGEANSWLLTGSGQDVQSVIARQTEQQPV